MIEIRKGTEFSNGTEFEVFRENFCLRCKKHKDGEDGVVCAFVEDGGCPIENAMEDARWGEKFPSDQIVTILENGNYKYWHVCKSFETDDVELMKAFKALFEEAKEEEA